jgi:hypothetical protein
VTYCAREAVARRYVWTSPRGGVVVWRGTPPPRRERNARPRAFFFCLRARATVVDRRDAPETCEKDL